MKYLRAAYQDSVEFTVIAITFTDKKGELPDSSALPNQMTRSTRVISQKHIEELEIICAQPTIS